MSDIATEIAHDSAVYKTLLESTKAIPWKIDWKTMTFAYIGPQIEHLLGWTQDSWISADDWANRMHPEDREWVIFSAPRTASGRFIMPGGPRVDDFKGPEDREWAISKARRSASG